jgi:hypothetical protein
MWSHHARRLLVALALGGKVSRIALVGIAWPYIILLRVEKRVGNAQFESNSKRVGSKDSAVATQWHTSTGGPASREVGFFVSCIRNCYQHPGLGTSPGIDDQDFWFCHNHDLESTLLLPLPRVPGSPAASRVMVIHQGRRRI